MERLDGKQRILKVAMDLIMKNGYSSVSIRKIVKQADVSIGTLYYHFPDGKLSILNSIFQSIGDEFIEINKFSEKIKSPVKPKIIKEILDNLLLVIRKYSPLIQGILMELITNKNFVVELKRVMNTKQDEKRDKFFAMLHSFLPESSGRERLFGIFANVILNVIYVHVFLEDFYGNDDELMEVLMSMIQGFFSKNYD